MTGPRDEAETAHSSGPAEEPTADPRLSIVLPTFNERDNIGPLIRRIAAALEGVPHEFLVMDDRSPDGTAETPKSGL